MSQDHPRSRGVYRASIWASYSVRGSSPLARGLPRVNMGVVLGEGIIPARAGFTRVWVRGRMRVTDHPRSRGVYTSKGRPARSASGSSPLARGLRAFDDGAGAGGGIIPARAGFTPVTSSPWMTMRDHPRSRGVYVVIAVG